MTKPFEQNNPMPGQFDQTSDYIVSMLKPVIKPKDGGAKAKAAAADAKPKKEKKEKAPKTPQPASDEDPFVKARLVIAKVLEVGHVENSDKLYCCKVQVGPEETRQVITGLRKFVPEAELTNKLVLCILNLKVAKLAGQTSEAMILATTCELNGELSVKVVNVPETATVGDVVGAEGVAPGAAGYPKECKSKFWDAVKEKLKVKGGVCTYDGKTLSCAAGPCVADASVLDGSPIS
jgi:aminoacyl tRNA synthase complex-interacting multifunctional protein 1